MSASEQPGTEPAALSDEARAREENRVRVLKLVVLGLGVVLAALALVVFSTLIVRAVKGFGGKPAPAASAAPGQAPRQIAIPPGSRVVSTALAEGRLAVTVEAEGRFTVLLIDPATLAETGRVVLAPGP
ncbi:DUF6476 family protein [Alsobacter sp. SYSU M60028]|uniref:DUF6476 family protein n=1 Tax=Alsobacter ponti TaxID=2962936 RepID=A0ABT1LIF5_9HYPH|nr:DUF6476 family protein [Alsobacter ponti]MCP8940918.1 DUF6476 family protein [Alsobacter ponti]